MSPPRTVRALVVAPQPFFSPRGTPFSVYYRTLVCSEAGVEMDLVTYGEGQDVDLPGVTLYRTPRFAFLGPVPIGPSFRKLFLDAFVALRMFARLCRRRYDFVHAHEEAVFLALLFRPLFRFALVYDMHSSLPQQLRNFRFSRSRTLLRIFEWLENRSIRGADAVITICPDLADYVAGRIPDPGRHTLIENSLFEPVRLKAGGSAPEAEAGAVAPPGRDPIVYTGTFEPYQGLSLLLEGFAIARREHPRAFLVMVGGSAAQVAAFRRQADALGLGGGDCRIGPRVSQAEARRLTRAAAVQVSPRSAGTNTPLKIYEQLASGVPLVATRIHSHTQVLDDEVAYLAEPTAEGLARGILEALRDGREGNPRADRARGLYERKYSRPVYEGKLRAVLRRIGACAE